MNSAYRSLKPGFYYNRLEGGKVLVLEIFKGWKDEEGHVVNGWYKNIFNCEEDAVNHMLKRGCPKKIDPSPTPRIQEGGEGQEHSVQVPSL